MMDRKVLIGMRELFQKALAGDTRAQQDIDAAIRRIARSVCLRGGPGGVNVDWEDIAQDAARHFFAVALYQFRKPGSEESFLYAIVRTTMLQALRSSARRRAREEAIAAEVEMPRHNPGPAIDVRIILSKLAGECATLLKRVFLEGESYSTLAGELDVLESSVRTKVTRCLRKARVLAESEGR